MAELKLEGDFSNINEKQLEFIKKAIEKQGYKNNRVIIEPLGKAGDNYMANVKRIRIEDSNGDKTMVVKISPQIGMHRDLGRVEKMFHNEHVMYSKVFPKFTQYEKTYNVPVQDRLKYPICYGSSDKAPNELIILEDLTELKYKMLDRFVPLENDCVKSLLKNLALLHSLSFVFKHKEPHVFQEYTKELVDVWSPEETPDKNMPMFIQTVENNLVNALDSDTQKNAVKGILSNMSSSPTATATISNLLKSEEESKKLVIEHGDAWTNNFLFSFDEGSVSSILIDYQLSKLANPVSDVLFMISTCTDYETRGKRFYEWIDYYHSVLDKSLSYFDLKTDFIYSRDQLYSDLKTYAKPTLAFALFMTGMLVLQPDEAVVVKEAMENADFTGFTTNTGATSKNPETNAMFKQKVSDITQSFLDFGLV